MTLKRVVAYESFITCWTAEFLHLLVLTNDYIIRDIHFERVHVICRLWYEDATLLTVVAFVFQVANQTCRIRVGLVTMTTLECFIFYINTMKYLFSLLLIVVFFGFLKKSELDGQLEPFYVICALRK
jgi:hypothetical protein